MGETVIRKLSFLSALLMLASFSFAAAPAGEVGPGVPAFMVRPGYKVTLAADHLGEARFLEFGDGDTLYLSQPLNGKILCLRDLDANGQYKTITTFVSHRPTVHGMQWYKGWLWFTQSGSIHKVQPKPDGTAGPIQDINTGELPQRGGHWWRSILVDDDGFYTSIGDVSNANDDYQLTDDIVSQREKIWHFILDGSGKKLFCTGIRNTEKLLHRPGTNEVWGCDHGSDNFGASLGEHHNGIEQPVTDWCPPDELNHYVQDGFYGHPFITGYGVPRYEYLKRKDILELAAKNIPPAWCNAPHWANDGWTFLKQNKLTGQAGDAIIAFHGSWNSAKKVGYCIQRIEFDPVTGKPCGSITLVSTLTPDGSHDLARPVDCAEAPDGSVLFSTDSSKQIYRLARVEKR
jgi:glucose/arabinose dehydrogenase